LKKLTKYINKPKKKPTQGVLERVYITHQSYESS